MLIFALVLIFFKLLDAIKTGEWQLKDKKGSFVNYDHTNIWHEMNEKNKEIFSFESIKFNNQNQLLLEDKSRSIYLKISDNIMYFSYNKDDIIQDNFSQILYYGRWIINPSQSKKIFVC